MMEAFHYRYHPAAVRFGAIVAAGEIGRVVHARARMAIPWFAFDRNDIRCVCARVVMVVVIVSSAAALPRAAAVCGST